MSLDCGFLELMVMIIGLTLPLQFLQSHSSEKSLIKVWSVQSIHLHFFVMGGSVDKLIVTDIDSNMSIIGTPCPKKDKISLLQLVLFNLSTE
jgi:hypothetical protein